MQRTGRSANVPRRPSNERISAGLNWIESQRGHTRRVHNTCGSRFCQAIVSVRIEELPSREGRQYCLRQFVHGSHLGFHRVNRRLSRANGLQLSSVSKLRRRVLLNLARMQCDVRDAKAGILRYLNDIKLRGVEFMWNRTQSARQSAMGRVFRCQAKPSSGARSRHPYGVPAGLANHRVEDLRRDQLHKRPVFAEGFPDRIHAVRQYAPVAQKNGMPLHGRAFLEVSGTRESVVSAGLEAGIAGITAIVCSAEESPVNADGLSSVASGSAPEYPVASGKLAGSDSCIFVRWREDRWFFTSLFLMRLMAAPAVRLRT